MKIDNIEMLQILSQDEYMENIAEIFRALMMPKFLSKSSGSTGEPLVFYVISWDAYYRTATSEA